MTSLKELAEREERLTQLARKLMRAHRPAERTLKELQRVKCERIKAELMLEIIIGDENA